MGVVGVPWPCHPPPAPPVVVVVIPSCGLVGTSKGLVVPVFLWSPCRRSTHQPPHEQLLMVPPTTHPTSSCSRGWGQVACRGDVAALVVVCRRPPSSPPRLPLVFVRLSSSAYAPASSGSQARGGCWLCWSCRGGSGPGSRGLWGVSDVAGMQGLGGCLPCGYPPQGVSQDPSGPS